MLEVTVSALEILKDYMRQQQLSSPVRISIMSGTCSGPTLRISIDKERENDYIADRGQIRFVVDRDLLATCGAIKVDFIEANSSCCCGGFCVSGEKRFLFTQQCNGSEESADFCRCDNLFIPSDNL